MSRKTELTSAVGATAMFFMIASASAGSAFAQDSEVQLLNLRSAAAISGLPIPQTDEQGDSSDGTEGQPDDSQTADIALPQAESLDELVRRIAPPASLSDELKCLASAIYHESRGEPLSGQLAVARVIVNRAESGRFPGSYCAVVRQPKQFSFVRAGHIPQPGRGTVAWDKARAIAVIADQAMWESPVKDALFFHATHVQPRWKLQRLARVSSHIFYR